MKVPGKSLVCLNLSPAELANCICLSHPCSKHPEAPVSACSLRMPSIMRDVPHVQPVQLPDHPAVMKVGDSEKELAGAEGQNPYSTMVDEANGLDKIEELQNHSNREIYEKAVNILETFFDVEDGENENLAPAVDANQARVLSKPVSVPTRC